MNNKKSDLKEKKHNKSNFIITSTNLKESSSTPLMTISKLLNENNSERSFSSIKMKVNEMRRRTKRTPSTMKQQSKSPRNNKYLKLKVNKNNNINSKASM